MIGYTLKRKRVVIKKEHNMMKIPVCPICGNRGWTGFKITNSDDLPPELDISQENKDE